MRPSVPLLQFFRLNSYEVQHAFLVCVVVKLGLSS